MILTPVVTLRGHRNIVRSLDYFPDGKRMISGSFDKTSRQWDLQAGMELEEVRDICDDEVRAVAVSRNGRWVITVTNNHDGDSDQVKACEVETGIVRILNKDGLPLGGLECIDISADNTLLTSGSMDGTVRIWNLDTGKFVAGPLGTEAGRVDAVRFSQDSNKLAVVSVFGNCLEVWDVKTRKLDRRVGKGTDADRRRLICDRPVFWTNKGTILAVFCPPENLPEDDPVPKAIYEFDASTLEPVGAPFQRHIEVISGLALSSDGALFASASGDNTIKFWAFESRQLLASFDVINPFTIILSPVSTQLAYATYTYTGAYEIIICDIPPDILSNIGTAQGQSALPKDLLKADATRRRARVRCDPAASPSMFVPPRPPRPLLIRDPQQSALVRLLRKLLRRSSRTDPPLDNQPCDPRDFPAPSLLRMTAQRRLDHAVPSIVDVPLAQGRERNAVAGAPKDDEDLVPAEYTDDPPAANTNPRQPTAAMRNNTGQHGSSRLCFCF
ncbi:YVTN repeat-like/Quino protein amine dehydrogenase [Rhizopogon salebrosus TDB-379]|nr:YVTN repeat-like/Quino protein amine dehydrogenase [Rhizopogon salebrosus TDB-379]